MFDFGYFGYGVVGLIIGLIDTILFYYMCIVIIRALLSWVNPDPYNFIVRFLHSVTDPLLNLIRRVLPNFLWESGLDFSPLVLIVLIIGVQKLLHLFLQSFRFPGAMR